MTDDHDVSEVLASLDSEMLPKVTYHAVWTTAFL